MFDWQPSGGQINIQSFNTLDPKDYNTKNLRSNPQWEILSANQREANVGYKVTNSKQRQAETIKIIILTEPSWMKTGYYSQN